MPATTPSASPSTPRSIRRRERDIAKRFVKSWRTAATGQDHQAAFSWDNFKRVRDKFPDVKFMLKGIGTGEDADLACQHGVWAVYCSNHGGRQLDHGRGSATVLPEVVDAVTGRAKVAVDGSFCRGSDIVKAICLGADWVGMGRLYCYGLAAAGAAGIERVIELLEEEMKEAMGLLGVTSLKQLDRSYVAAAMPTNLPGVHSAFPLLNLKDQGYLIGARPSSRMFGPRANDQPRPTNGILVAITVMNCTLASSGRLSM